MNLFLDTKLPEFSKTAAEVTLPEDPSGWQQEILQEIYKQAPFIADYDPSVVMDRLDGERGTAFGHIEVGNKTELNVSQGDPAAQVAGIRHVRIPIIVRDGKLFPFDLMVTEDAKVFPLTERRLRSALFRPQVFDVTSRTPGDQSLISALYPPYRQNYGFGGGGATMSAGMGKEGGADPTPTRSISADDMAKMRAEAAALPKSAPKAVAKAGAKPGLLGRAAAFFGKKASILEAVLPTALESDYTRTAESLQEVAEWLVHNKEAMAHPLKVLSGFQPQAARTLTEKVAHALIPSVIQVARTNEGYVVKKASAQYWHPTIQRVDRGELVRTVGAEVALLIDKTGSVTSAMGEDLASEPEEQTESDTPKLITDYGIYKVQDQEGKHLIGFAFPNLIDVEGHPLPMTLFTNGSQTAVQGEIVGVRVAEGLSVTTGRPKGYGAFYKVLPNGRVEAMVPMDLQMNFTGADGQVALVGHTMEGREIQVSIEQGIQKPTLADEQHLCIPEDWRWLPLEGTKAVSLVAHPDEYMKVAEIPLSVQLRGDASGSFSISGGPIEKVAKDERELLSMEDTLFYLAGLGVPPAIGIRKMAETIQRMAPVTVAVSRDISPSALVNEEAIKTASASPSFTVKLRQNLAKEAAFVPDPLAVDTMLSLGFLNPENVMTFVSYMPQLDEAQAHLGDLLVAARLGLREVPVYALERAMKGLEDVIEGLNVLAFQKN